MTISPRQYKQSTMKSEKETKAIPGIGDLPSMYVRSINDANWSMRIAAGYGFLGAFVCRIGSGSLGD
jgi:hypothetical protein